jgi:mycothiol synthase
MSAGLRVPREEDIPEIVRLTSLHSPESTSEDGVRRMWASPRFDLERDARLDGDAYACIEEFGEGRVWIDVYGHSSQEILDWAEKRASAVGHRLLSGSWATNEQLLRELEARGYALVRHSHRMTIDLSDPAPDPVWPSGIEVRAFRAGDERAFHEAQQETFADSWEPTDEPFEEWAYWLLEGPSFDPSLWFLALDGAETAGYAICHPHLSDPGIAWVRLLGVRRPWRRRGLGRALLLHAFAEFRARGFRRAGLGVDADSLTGAHTLYESAGMHVAARFDVYEKALS